VLGAGCDLVLGKTYRYKITVEVGTPKGTVQGSAVREITYYRDSIRLPDSVGGAKQRGEAVAIDLPNGQSLFAVQGADAHELQAAIGSLDDLDKARTNHKIYVIRQIPEPMIPSKLYGYPMLVRFRDENKPASVEEIDPHNFARSFGGGYFLKRITIQMTDEPLTTGIHHRLPWLTDYLRRHANLRNDSSGIVRSNDLAENLGPGSFTTGI